MFYIITVIETLVVSIWMLLLTIITGQPSKVCVYHFTKRSEGNTLFDITDDYYIKTQQVKNVSVLCKEQIINSFVQNLQRNQKFNNVVSSIDFPLFDGKDIVGTQGYTAVLDECLQDYVKSLK